MCAIGKYTIVSQTAIITITAENLMRSTVAPSISAAVIAANVIWNEMNTYSLMTSSVKVAAVLSGVTPDRKYLPQPTTALPSGPNAVP